MHSSDHRALVTLDRGAAERFRFVVEALNGTVTSLRETAEQLLGMLDDPDASQILAITEMAVAELRDMTREIVAVFRDAEVHSTPLVYACERLVMVMARIEQAGHAQAEVH